MRNLTKRLISHEHRAGSPSDSRARAAFRVCEKLRRPLSTLTGVVGYHSLLSRALKLARASVPWLAGVRIQADGTFEFSPGVELQLDGAEALRGGEALITKLLELLVIFIGETLTLRLVQEVWPKTTFTDAESAKDAL